MQRTAILLALLLPGLASGVEKPKALMANCYLQFLLSHEVLAQAERFGEVYPEPDRAQIQDAVGRWCESKVGQVRGRLETGLGDKAQDQFGQFVAEYSQAEKDGNPEYLGVLSSELGIDPKPADFAAFRKTAFEQRLPGELSEASTLLGEVQTWAELRKKSKDVPVLNIWLTRNKALASQFGTPAPMTPGQKTVQDLADAEPVPVEYKEDEKAENTGALDFFGGLRTKKREKALEKAHQGMQQITSERQQWETENAAAKSSDAQAEAEALKNHADKLAAVEKDALEQRQKGWGARLKTVIGTTVSAASSSFLGPIGQRAGEEAVNAIFEKKKNN